MKVLIELDDDMFNDIRESDFEVSRNIVRNFQATISDSIRNGIPIPDNTNNYDVLKAVFGNISAFRIKDKMEFEKGFEFWFCKPYKRGKENG